MAEGNRTLIVNGGYSPRPELFHIVVQLNSEDDDITMCGIQVTVEDPSYLLNFDRDYLLSDMLCIDCCRAFARTFSQNK